MESLNINWQNVSVCKYAAGCKVHVPSASASVYWMFQATHDEIILSSPICAFCSSCVYSNSITQTPSPADTLACSLKRIFPMKYLFNIYNLSPLLLYIYIYMTKFWHYDVNLVRYIMTHDYTGGTQTTHPVGATMRFYDRIKAWNLLLSCSRIIFLSFFPTYVLNESHTTQRSLRS